MRPPGNEHDTTTPPPTTHHDATGLHLQSATTGGLSLRIARSSRGPLSPPPRQGTPDASWSRYDVAGWTVYTAKPGKPRTRRSSPTRGVVLVGSPIQLSWVLRGVQLEGDSRWSPVAYRLQVPPA